MSWVERLRRLAPVRAIHVETVRFDTHALAAGKSLAGVEYQHGTLHGYEVREYLLEKWGWTCAYCGASGIPLNLDHIQPRSRGGSDRISNLCLACVPCNQAKNSMPITAFLADRPKVLARVLAEAKTPLRDAAAVNATRWTLYEALTATGLPVRCSSGARTKWNRHRTCAPKSHTLDALHLGELSRRPHQRQPHSAGSTWPRQDIAQAWAPAPASRRLRVRDQERRVLVRTLTQVRPAADRPSLSRYAGLYFFSGLKSGVSTERL